MHCAVREPEQEVYFMHANPRMWHHVLPDQWGRNSKKYFNFANIDAEY